MSCERLPNGWVTQSLDALVEIFDGPHATPEKTAEGQVFLGISNLENGRLDLSDVARLSEEDFTRWTRRVRPRAGDVVFSYETRLGQAAQIPPGLHCCLGRRMGLLRAKSGQLDPQYLLYAYLGREFQRVIRDRTVHGSTVDRIPLREMGSFPLVVPPLAEQRRIVSVLGALDERLASDRRVRSATLATVRALHDFHRQSAIRYLPLALLATVLRRGIVPRYADDGGALVVNQRCIRGDTLRFGPARGHDDTSKPIDDRGIRIGDVLVNSTGVGTLGRVARVNRLPARAVVADSHVTVVRAAPGLVAPAYLAAELLSRQAELAELGEGSTGQAELSRERLAFLEIALPADDAQHEFAAVAEACWALQAGLEEEAETLSEIRDGLLPRLVSGEIRVPDTVDLDEAIGPAVEGLLEVGR